MGAAFLLCSAKWHAEQPAVNTEKMRNASRLRSNFSRIIRHELELVSDFSEVNINSSVWEY
jgi:hypothetical protein